MIAYANHPIHRDSWPIWAKALAKFSVAGDRGLGDVIARTLENNLDSPRSIESYNLTYPLSDSIESRNVIEGWPFWAKALKLLAKPEDKGIGDVIARTIGDENSEAFKIWYKQMFGKDCGCNGRQADLNRKYPISENIQK